MSTSREIWQRLLRPVYRALRGMLNLGLLQRTDDSKQIQQVQITGLAGQTRDKINHYQPYGFTSVAKPGAEPVYAQLGADPARTVVIVLSDGRVRKKGLKEGETALYTDEGDYILLKRGRIIQVVAGSKLDVTAPEVAVKASTKVTLDTPTVECTNDLQVGGSVTAQGDVSDQNGSMQEMRDTYNAHKHTGVTAGGSTSGTPDSNMS